MTEAFWSISIKEKDKEKTAFISQYGLWEWNSMPFGLSNAPATQQRFMDKILSGLQWQICINYIDDIVVFSKTFDEHLQSLEKVLERLRENKLRINLDKVKLCQPKFTLLGFTAIKKGILCNDKKVRAIINYPEPANHKELQSFLGLVSWCQRFIHKCLQRTYHLRKLLTETKFQWNQEAEKKFLKLKEIIANIPMLVHPNFEKTFYIHVDALKKGYGAILTQHPNDPINKPAPSRPGILKNHQIIAFASLTLLQLHSSYTNPKREAYGIYWAINKFKEYTYGKYTVVYSDHQSFTKLANSPIKLSRS